MNNETIFSTELFATAKCVHVASTFSPSN